MNYNKKGAFDTTSELIKWIPKIIVVALVVSTIILIIASYVKITFEIDKLQQVILRQRFVYSENCLAHEDNGVKVGIIDKNKFSQRNLENCFQANEKIGVSLNLITKDLKTINLNDNLINKFNFCFDKKHFTCSNNTYYVLVNDGNNFEQGLLNIAMIKVK